jgi:acylphosphatase
MAAVRLVVRGRVQGVGFRNHVYLEARHHRVCGEVWNRSDGAVEVLAEHPDHLVLDEFCRVVEAGPGYVRDVQVDVVPERGFVKFEVV